MAQRILVTEPIVPSVLSKLEENYTVDVGERKQFNDEQALVNAIPRYDGLLAMLTNPVTSQVIEAGERLEVIANHAVGYNNIDVKAAHRHNIAVANTPDVLTDSCAEFTMGLLLAVARNLFDAQEYLLAGKYKGWEPLGFLGMELKKKTLGIIGMGRIGQAVAERAQAFGMNIIYHNRSRVADSIEHRLQATYMESPQELVKKSDVISLHCPLTKQTLHMINEEMISLMPKHAILLNTGRGPLIDEAKLAKALHEGMIGGAGLDVFEHEPKVHPDLKSAPNCVLTPHMASASYETREAIGMLAADAIIGVLEDRPASSIPNLIQP